MTKKVLAVLAAALILFSPAFAAGQSRIDLLQKLNVINGYTDGSLRLENPVTRAEFTKMAVAISPYRDQAASNILVSPFVDVTHKHWAAPYIHLAVTNKLVTGYKDATFRPDSNVTYEEVITVALRILGYTDDEFQASWPYGQLGVAQNIGLTDGFSAYIGYPMTRGDVAHIFCNLLTTPKKGSQADYIETLNYKITEDVILIATADEDSSVGAGKIYTSAGTFRIDSSFDTSLTSQKGDIVTDGDRLVLFSPAYGSGEAYNVYSVFGEDIVLYKDGEISNFKIDNQTTLYYETMKSTVRELIPKINPGDMIVIYRDQSGTVDYAMLRSGNLLGPVTISDSTPLSSLPIGENPSVIRDGASSSLPAIQKYDVVYYSRELNTLWVYSKKITGVFEKALPSREQVSQIVVSGVTYNLSTIEAVTVMGTGGWAKINDTVTLLLGRDGSVVDVISPNEADIERYVVYSVVGSNVIVYKSGNMLALDVDKDTTAYLGSRQYALRDVLGELEIGYTISLVRNADKSVDYMTIDRSSIDGPFTVRNAGWASAYGIDPDAVIIRDGAKSSADGINTYDIIYYSKALKTVWAYSRKVTGVYEAASPNKDTPQTITLSGMNYKIEGVEAYNALSSGGNIIFGDTITLLLGKNGDIADVLSPQAAAQSSVVGYVIDTGIKEFVNYSGNTYTSHYIKIVQTDGKTYEYTTASSYELCKNQIVKVSFAGGKARPQTVRKSSDIYGKYDHYGKKLGQYPVSSNIQIIDVSTTNPDEAGVCAPVYSQRLDGTNLLSGNILYYETDSQGAIEKLVLNDFTGDIYSYGIVTHAENNTSGMSISGAYTYMIDGITHSLKTQGSYFTVYSGSPVKIIMSGGQALSMTKLSEISGAVSNITESSVTVGKTTYPISDKVSVYLKTSTYDYLIVPIGDIVASPSSYSVKAYVDKEPANGGRVRVIVVMKK